jgi:peptide/nickel transport system ATP-binding protein
MIAMAIAAGLAQPTLMQARLLIADEPTTALDVTVRKEILELLRRLRGELGLGLLFITHDLGVVAQVADRVAVMYAGRVVEEGPSGEVLRAPRHPYRQGLLAASPKLERGKLTPIPGSVPKLMRSNRGVDFRRDECNAAVPELDGKRWPCGAVRFGLMENRNHNLNTAVNKK